MVFGDAAGRARDPPLGSAHPRAQLYPMPKKKHECLWGVPGGSAQRAGQEKCGEPGTGSTEARCASWAAPSLSQLSRTPRCLRRTRSSPGLCAGQGGEQKSRSSPTACLERGVCTEGAVQEEPPAACQVPPDPSVAAWTAAGPHTWPGQPSAQAGKGCEPPSPLPCSCSPSPVTPSVPADR